MALHKNETGASLHETKITRLVGSPVSLSTVATIAGIIAADITDPLLPVLYVAASTAAGDWVPLGASSAGLAAHLADTTDAHPASAITNTPSGNLAATDVQTALNELQSDIDTRLLASNNLSDVGVKATAFNNLSPMTTLGDVIYGAASGAGTRLAGNTTTTVKFLKSLGSGGLATAPVWAQVAFSDLSGSVSATQLPNPSATTLGGIESYVAVSHQWINAISTSGVPSSTQPAFSDISGTLAASQIPAPTASTLGGIESYAAVTNQWINAISLGGVPSSTQPAFSNISGNLAVSQLNSGTSASATTFWCGNGTWATPAASAAALGVLSKSANYTAAWTDGVIVCNGTFTVTLPASSTGAGVSLYIKNIGTGIITIAPFSGNLIDGETSQVLGVRYTGVILIPDGGTAVYVF